MDSSVERKLPQRKVGRSFEGWRLELNRHRVGELFDSADAARAHAETLCSYKLTWEQKITDPEGNSYFQGGHPEIMSHEKLHSRSDRDLADKLSEIIHGEIGFRAWWDRWYVEPEYYDIYKEIDEAIWPLHHSKYYAAPQFGKYWAVYQEFDHREIEAFMSKEEAIETATRLAIGIKSKRSIDRSRKNIIKVVTVFAILSLLLFLCFNA
jgi:hypothetical protein